MNLLGVCGSLQARSGNRALLEAARASAPDGVTIAIFDGLRALPPFDPDVDASGAPAPVVAWRGAIGASDALLVASPEYGFSLPGAVKNAIDWVIGSGELEGKVVGITAAVSGAGRGRRGLEALSVPLRAVSARIVGGASIVRGPAFERDVAALVAAIADEVRTPAPAPRHGLGVLRPSAAAEAWLEAFNRRDLPAREALFAPGAEHDARDVAPPGAQLEAERLLEDGEHAILEWRDARSTARGCALFRVRRGEIVALRAYALVI